MEGHTWAWLAFLLVIGFIIVLFFFLWFIINRTHLDAIRTKKIFNKKIL